MTFENLNLIDPIKQAVKAEGYSEPTPIQEKAIPMILQGRDILGSAQTGTGKTAAFAIPILQNLYLNKSEGNQSRNIKVLILTPTRELAVQIGDSFTAYGKFLRMKHVVVYGGVSQHPQTLALNRGVDILIATPGRLLDLMEQGYVHLDSIQTFVLDEADRMLEMGFIQDVRRVQAKLPAKLQTLLFSATIPGEIADLAKRMLNNPVEIIIEPKEKTADLINQSVYFVAKENKGELLVHVLKDETINSALVFTRTKRGADKVSKMLNRNGIRSEAIHGDKSQFMRQKALDNLKSRYTRVLVASDIASRGLDIEELSCVINYEIPNIPETYIHRIGRTGRAGVNGTAISFCDSTERVYLKDIHKLLTRPIPVVRDQPEFKPVTPIADIKEARQNKKFFKIRKQADAPSAKKNENRWDDRREYKKRMA